MWRSGRYLLTDSLKRRHVVHKSGTGVGGGAGAAASATLIAFECAGNRRYPVPSPSRQRAPLCLRAAQCFPSLLTNARPIPLHYPFTDTRFQFHTGYDPSNLSSFIELDRLLIVELQFSFCVTNVLDTYFELMYSYVH